MLAKFCLAKKKTICGVAGEAAEPSYTTDCADACRARVPTPTFKNKNAIEVEVRDVCFNAWGRAEEDTVQKYVLGRVEFMLCISHRQTIAWIGTTEVREEVRLYEPNAE